MADSSPIRGLPPVHPGEQLKDMLPHLDTTTQGFAERLGIGRQTLYDIMAGRRSVTAPIALRLAKAIGGRAEFWMALQAQYDLKVAAAELADELAHITRVSRISAAVATAAGVGGAKSRGFGVRQGGKVITTEALAKTMARNAGGRFDFPAGEPARRGRKA